MSGKFIIQESPFRFLITQSFSHYILKTGCQHLPDSVIELVELLAKKAHDTWAEGRIKEGWTYGSERDDSNKKHPCLVPYEELPDSEKEYDRNSVKETLKAIIALGYRQEKKVWFFATLYSKLLFAGNCIW